MAFFVRLAIIKIMVNLGLIDYLTLGILISLLLAQIYFKPSSKKLIAAAKISYLGLVVSVIGVYVYLVVAQTNIWAANPLTKYLVPPYRPLSYVIGYYFIRFLLYYLVAFLISLAFYLFFKNINRRAGGVYLENFEIYAGALTIFALGNPGWPFLWLYYLGAFWLVYLAVQIFAFLKKKAMERISAYFIWLPTAILVIIIKMLIFS